MVNGLIQSHSIIPTDDKESINPQEAIWQYSDMVKYNRKNGDTFNYIQVFSVFHWQYY